MITKNGVCYDLKETPYTFEWRGILYHFSSENHMSKFIRNLRNKEEWLDDSLSRRFKCTVHLPVLADIQLYTQVETRGFYLTTKGTEYLLPSSVYVEANMMLLGVEDGAF